MKPSSHRGRAALATAARIAAAVALALPPVAITAHAHEADPEEQALRSLIDAELAFARTGSEQGIRAAFLANFAQDGIAFEPAPVRLVPTWSARPANPNPKALETRVGAGAGGRREELRLGLHDRPFKLTDTTRDAPPKHGVFFSVWRRDAAGTWKVALDMGIGTPQPVDFARAGPGPAPPLQGPRRRADATEGADRPRGAQAVHGRRRRERRHVRRHARARRAAAA